MHKHIGSAHNSHTSLFDSATIIIVFKESAAENLIQRPDKLIGFSRHHNAKERCRSQRYKVAKVPASVMGGLYQHFLHVCILEVYFGLVANIIGDRSDKADGFVALQIPVQGS